MSRPDASAGMIRRLVLKDWYFHRHALLGYLLGGAFALCLVGSGGSLSFYLGSSLLITLLIALGIHLPMSTVIEERRRRTLAFVMSLPVTPRDYTLAKMLANLLILLVPWLALLAGTAAVILARPALPDGLLPFAVVLLVEILAGSCLILGVALVTESLGWTVLAMVFGNLFFQGFLYWVAHLPSVAAAIETEDASFNAAELGLLAAEIAFIVLALQLTFFLQTRKKDFL